jgi:hypothetical protein
MSKRLALVIGNSDYEDQRLARLTSPNVDVAALAAVLRSPELGAFSLVRSLLNERAATVRREIASFFVTASSRDDLTLLYFSGHGIKNGRGELFLAVADTETDLLGATAIPASFISDEMDGCPSRRLVLILDCCNSGAVLRGAKASTGENVDTRGAFEGTGSGRVILTATDATQYAWEGDKVSGTAQSSMFTRFLVDGLRTGAADLDSDGSITVDELYDYVHDQVVALTPNQKPRKFVINQEGELVIARAAPKPVELPAELAAAIDSSFVGARVDAVRDLDAWLHGSHPGRRLAAQAALGKLARDDSRRVAAAAQAALQVVGPLPAEPEPDQQPPLLEVPGDSESQAGLAQGKRAARSWAWPQLSPARVGAGILALAVVAGLGVGAHILSTGRQSPPPSQSPEAPQRIESALPQSRQEAAAVAASGRLYLVGGVDKNAAGATIYEKSTFVHDGTWHAGPDLPIEINHASGATVGSTPYIAGGFPELVSGPASARVFRLDGGQWHEVAPMHHQRGAAALVPVAGRLYAMGGSTVHNAGVEVVPVEAFDPASNSWTDVSNLPMPRDHLAGFAYGSLACVAGGRAPAPDNGQRRNTTRVDCYDPRARKWSTPIPPLPVPTSAAGVGVLGAEVILAGGENYAQPAILDQVLRLRGAQWQVEAMTVPRQALTLAVHGDRLWACGGGVEPNNVHPVSNCTSIGR